MIFYPDDTSTNKEIIGDPLLNAEPISKGVEIIKGHMYTKNTKGFIVSPEAKDGIAQFLRGRFQAVETSSDSPPSGSTGSDLAEGSRRLKFQGLDSFIAMYAEAGVMSGQLVDLSTSTPTKVIQNRVKPNTTGVMNSGTVGICWGILDPGAPRKSCGARYGDRTHKATTDADDLVLVKMVS